jgi:hypothetical protein
VVEVFGHAIKRYPRVTDPGGPETGFD